MDDDDIMAENKNEGQQIKDKKKSGNPNDYQALTESSDSI
jgi:hypothetical protein